jgi:hypothetical protein
MNYPSSFCTISTKSCKQELIGLLLSLSIHHNNSNVYILCDSETKDYIEQSTPQPQLNIKWIIELDKYSNYNRKQMEKMNIWNDFQMAKANVIEYALKEENDTLFLDSDIVILNKLYIKNDKKYDLGVSPHYMKKNITDKYGYYNGGMIWTCCKQVPELWKKYSKTSRYYDQASIEDLVKHFSDSYFEFGEEYNLQSWRIVLSVETTKQIKDKVNIKNDKLYYNNEPLKFVHTHFNHNDHAEFNNFIIEKLKQAKLYRELLIIYRVINNKWIVIIPEQPQKNPKYNHSNDSFRIIPYLFKEKYNDVDVKIKNTGHCWIEPNILLYDRPQLHWLNDEIKQSSLLLLGNGDINDEGKTIQTKYNINVQPWIFWPRRSDNLENILNKEGILGYNERTIESIFIGNYENDVQEQFRNIKNNNDWSKVIKEFHITSGKKHKFTQDEYLKKLRLSKYGLCLRGYGKKCHREVELMAFGTVPVVTEFVNINSYYDPPLENIHYIKANSNEEFVNKIKDISEEEWTKMSNSCYEWYQRNVYSQNCFKNMMEYMLFRL